MATVIDGANAFLGPYDVSGEAVEFVANWAGAVHEHVPANSQSGVRKDGGFPNDNATLNGVIDKSGTTYRPFEEFYAQGLQKVPFAFPFNLGAAIPSVGDRTIFGNVVQQQPQLVAENGELVRWTTELGASGPLMYGFVATYGQETATGQAAGVQLGPVPAGSGIFAALFVPTAVSGTIDVIIESDDANTFASPTTRLTFGQVATTPSAEYKNDYPAAGITDDWWRASWTGASTPDHTILVVFGIF